MFSSKGEELEKTKKETLEMLQTVEEHGIGEKKFFGGESIGIADIAFGSVVYGLEIIEEALGEGAVFEAHRFPRLHAWIKNFKQVPCSGPLVFGVDSVSLLPPCRLAAGCCDRP
ncbi:GLUTATHIONE S-TRANSFERASE GST SUPERFAMILY GST DOMAIN CONTAINING [Salix viminalis]|uniref:GLUTATHIONE S-TRANSFERASE GST SUPERFAMILY GST DOMAIN CONTAINING n=1 Tax=Salix viminalis TaxID=40686 RepID=A0A9Q0U1C9_SALVM|nr:GLUTATHIONE S-TRANSFERASE GST SUPERFAMILY GST DOMAIN CONTAINING [Salix viminalis]